MPIDFAKLQEEARANQGKDINLEYRLDMLGMFRAWQVPNEDNVAPGYPINLLAYIPPETKSIHRALLTILPLNFRSYGAATDEYAGGRVYSVSDAVAWSSATVDSYSSTTYAGGHSHTGTANSVPAHTHGGAVAADGGHYHDLVVSDYENDHIHQLPYHAHGLDIPAHLHLMAHGIYEGPPATDVGVLIDGADHTVALGGPFNTNTYQLDIRQYLTKGALNTVSLTSTTLGRIHASLFLELYLARG